MSKISILTVGILLSNIYTSQAFAEGNAAPFVGFGIGAGAGTVAGAIYNSPEFSSGYSIDQIVNSKWTPGAGVVTIEQDPTPQNLRNFYIRTEQDRIARLRDGKIINVVGGSASNDAIVLARISAIEAEIARIKSASDLSIIARDPELKPYVTYGYVNKAQLRNLLEESEKFNGNKFHVRFSPRGTSAIARVGGAAAIGGVISFVVVNSLNPASAAETPSDGSIPFADTKTAD